MSFTLKAVFANALRSFFFFLGVTKSAHFIAACGEGWRQSEVDSGEGFDWRCTVRVSIATPEALAPVARSEGVLGERGGEKEEKKRLVLSA